MEDEIWSDIKNYEGIYQVSNYGRIKSKHLDKEKIIKPSRDKDGYLIVSLYKQNLRKQFKVHRLVGESFINNPNNLPMINHKDENKENNFVDNLEWCDCKYNNNYGTAIIRRKEKLNKPILQYSTDGLFVREYDSVENAVKHLRKKCKSAIQLCLCGINKTGFGFIWRTKKDSNFPLTIEPISKNVGSSRKVVQYTKDMSFVAEFESGIDAQRRTGICQSSILKCCKNQQYSSGGYKWKYK